MLATKLRFEGSKVPLRDKNIVKMLHFSVHNLPINCQQQSSDTLSAHVLTLPSAASCSSPQFAFMFPHSQMCSAPLSKTKLSLHAVCGQETPEKICVLTTEFRSQHPSHGEGGVWKEIRHLLVKKRSSDSGSGLLTAAGKTDPSNRSGPNSKSWCLIHV